jgi:hypothetical protein
MTRYSPSRSYLSASLIAVALGLFSVWFAVGWPPAVIAVALFFVSATLLLYFALRPPIEIRDKSLLIGRREIFWKSIRRVDRTGWISPLVVHLTLADEQRLVLVHPGDLDSANSLLRHLRRLSTRALIDGIPHRQFWGEEDPPTPAKVKLQSPAYPVLLPEDEEEVERLYRRLKTVGNLDSANPGDEK